MRGAEEIVEVWRNRRNRSEIYMSRMRRIRDVYNGDIVLPFAEDTEPAVANMVLMGIDQKAERIASVMPQVWFPPYKMGVKKAEEKAQNRREAVMAWWQDNDIHPMLRNRARHFLAYGRSVTLVKPNLHEKRPDWHVRNPLGTFPADEVEFPGCPVDIITAYNRPFAWLKQHYPAIARDTDPYGEFRDDTQIVLLEYSDADQISLVYAGIDATYEPGFVTLQWETDNWGGHPQFLVQIPNRVGRALGTVAVRPTLDREQGEFDQIVGMYGAQAKLTALEIAAVERDVFPDVYLVSRPGEQARFIRGPFDGRSGEVNVVAGGEVTTERIQPGFNTAPMIDRLERSQRITGGIPAEFGGESTTNVRTGRRGDSILSATVDFPIASAQESFAKSLEAEDRLAIDIAKAWWGDRKTTYHFVEGRKNRQGTYTPNELFDGPTHHKISYPVAGADLNNLVVGIGQRIGLGTMSKQSAAEMDPLIDDPEFEKDRMTSEALNEALLASVQQAAVGGMLAPQVIGRVSDLVRSGEYELPEALRKAMDEESERREEEQAQQAPTPGIGQAAAEATGQPQASPSVGEAGQGLQNLGGLFNALRNSGGPREALQAGG